MYCPSIISCNRLITPNTNLGTRTDPNFPRLLLTAPQFLPFPRARATSSGSPRRQQHFYHTHVAHQMEILNKHDLEEAQYPPAGLRLDCLDADSWDWLTGGNLECQFNLYREYAIIGLLVFYCCLCSYDVG